MQKSETGSAETKEQKREEETARREEIKEMGTLRLEGEEQTSDPAFNDHREIEGHEAVSGNTKATKYEHLLPKLAEAEDSDETGGS